MTKQELAQKVKAKYPQYQNIEDNELADKILAKYPVYQSQITEKQGALSKFASNVKSKITGRTSGLKESAETALDKGTVGAGARLAVRTGGAVAGSIGDILFEGLKVVAPDKLEELAKQGIGKAMSTDPAQKVIGSITEWAERNPESAKDLQDVLEIAGIVPVLKGAQVGVKTGIQTAKTVGRAGIQAGERALTSGRQAIGKTLATTGAVGEKAGKSLVSASFPPTASQARSLISYKAKTPLLQRVQLAAKSAERAPITPAEVAIKYNLVGLSRSEIGARAKRITNRLFENQVKPVIEGIDKKVAIKDIFNQVKKEIAKTADTSKKKSLLNALESLQDDYKNVSNLSYKRLDKIKSEMAKSLPAKVWKGQDIAGEINNIRKMFSDKARVLIRKELPDNVKRIYDEYGSLLSIVEKGEKSLQRSLDVGILGLTSEAIRRAGTPLTTIGGKLVSEAGTLTKRLGQKLLPKKPKPLPKPKGEILKSTPLVNNKSILGTDREFAKNLTNKDRIIERKAFARVDKDADKILKDYKAKNGKIVNTDSFRPYFKDDGYVGYRAASVQEPASELSKRAYLDGLKNEGKYATIYAGGSGTGKTSAVKNIPSISKILNDSSVILDGNLSSIGSAIKRITEATNAGKKVPIIYVYRDPVDSLVNGVVKRSINNADEMGRIVPNSIIADNHIGSWETVSKLFKDGFDVKFIDNSLGAGKAKRVKYSDLANKIKYPSREELTQIFNNKIKELYESKTKIGKREIRKQEFAKYLKKS